MKSSVQKDKIIFVTPSMSSFARNDISSLEKKYKVIVNQYNWSKKQYTPFFLFHQVFLILRYIFSVKKIFISFGGYWAFIPALFGKLSGVPVYIILHGTDCASIPSVNYGSLRKFLLKKFCRQSYNLATTLLPVSSSLVTTKNTFHSDDVYSYQGFKHFFPKNKTYYEVIANGIDEKFWSLKAGIIKEPKSFMAVFSADQFILKGGDLIVELARRLPECTFYIAGLGKPENILEVPVNVFFLGQLTRENLREYYRKSRFHFQISIFEGFGISLCEAMLCECIPIGSSVNSIPEIIGDTGFVLEKRNLEELEILVYKVLALEAKDVLGEKARERIKRNYTIEKREERLLSLS